MSDGWSYKAGMFPGKHAMEEGAPSRAQERTNFRSGLWADHVAVPPPSPPSPPSPPLGPRGHNPRSSAAPMETVVGKHESVPRQRGEDICPGAEAGSGVFTNRPPADFGLRSPTDFSSVFSSRASSRESLFSDGWDGDRSWSAMRLFDAASPLTASRAVSPCSSVRSGAFTPTVVRARRHVLATGASLLHMPQASCLSSCESLASSVGARSPPPAPRRRRPPLTRLSLLTAILRKGRLPVLSPALQRPYSPCWPINHVTLASCSACSAASGLAPVSPGPPSSPPPPPPPPVRAETPAAQSRGDRDSFRRRPALPAVHVREGYTPGPPPSDHDGAPPSGEEPRFQTVYSRPVSGPVVHRATGAEQGAALPRLPLPQPPSPAARLKGATADGARLAQPNESTEPGGPRPSQPWWRGGPLSPGQRRAANQTDPCSPVDAPQQIARAKQPSTQTAGGGNAWARRPCSPLPRPSPPAALGCVSPQPPPLPSRSKKSQPSVSEPPRCPAPKSPAAAAANARLALDSPGGKLSSCLSPSRYAPIAFPGWPSPNSSRASTPDRFALTPSPASQARDLTPCASPSPSLRSTPSPRPGGGGAHREGKPVKPHKIKSSYKSLAAIPTNTLLLDQQVIDKQVEQVDDSSGTGDVEDPHSEMCSPAQLRQESEELYAVIDKILEDATPKSPTSLGQPSGQTSSQPVTGLKQTADGSLGRPLGRETKYATVRCLSSLERMRAETQTKPGVIRPMSAVPRLQVDDYVGDDQTNPFTRYLADTPAAYGPTPEDATLAGSEDAGPLRSRNRAADEAETPGDAGPTSTSALFIMEADERCPHRVKPLASWQGASTTFSRAEVLPDVSETRI